MPASSKIAAQITTPSGGSVYLIAPSVENHGVINAPNGEVILAAGQKVELIDTGTPGVKVEIVGSEGDATNLGTIASEAGRIGMAGVLVKNSGTLNASSVVREGGQIFLRADVLMQTGEIRTDGQSGGSIQAQARNVLSSGRMSADGSQGPVARSMSRLTIESSRRRQRIFPPTAAMATAAWSLCRRPIATSPREP